MRAGKPRIRKDTNENTILCSKKPAFAVEILQAKVVVTREKPKKRGDV
jgi:hypothetical protein